LEGGLNVLSPDPATYQLPGGALATMRNVFVSAETETMPLIEEWE